MNHATSSSPATSPEAGPSNHHEGPTAGTAAAAPTATAGGSESSRSQQNATTQKTQKLAFLDHLIRNFDIVVFCQLSILYYMDCSLSKFLLRALPHWFLFSPKPERILPPSSTHPNNGPYLGPIVITNLICILLHTFFSPPAASEAARGYLHGGMIIDFVGQASPVGRWKLVAFDLMCLGLQIVMMALTVEKMALHGARAARSGGESAVEGTPLDGRQGQDLDAEERGVLGAEERAGEGIEMQDLGRRRAGRTGGEEDAERDELLVEREVEGVHPLDKFYAGDYMLARLHLLETLQAEAFRRPASTTTTTTTTATTTTTTNTSGRFAVGRYFPTLLGYNFRRIEDRG